MDRSRFERGEIHGQCRHHAAQSRTIDLELIVTVLSDDLLHASWLSSRQPFCQRRRTGDDEQQAGEL